MSTRTRAAYALESSAVRPTRLALRYWQSRQIPAWGRVHADPDTPSIHEVINASAGVRNTWREASNMVELLKCARHADDALGVLQSLERMATHVGPGKPTRRAATAWKWLRRVRADSAGIGKDRARQFHTMNFTQGIEGQPVNRQLEVYRSGFKRFGGTMTSWLNQGRQDRP